MVGSYDENNASSSKTVNSTGRSWAWNVGEKCYEILPITHPTGTWLLHKSSTYGVLPPLLSTSLRKVFIRVPAIRCLAPTQLDTLHDSQSVGRLYSPVLGWMDRVEDADAYLEYQLLDVEATTSCRTSRYGVQECEWVVSKQPIKKFSVQLARVLSHRPFSWKRQEGIVLRSVGEEHVVGSNGHGGLRPYLARGGNLKPGDLVSFYPAYPGCYNLAAGCLLVEREYLEVQSADDNEFCVSILLCENSEGDTFYELPHLGRASDPMKLIRSGWSGYASKFTMKAAIDTRVGTIALAVTNLVTVHKFAALRLKEHVRRLQQPDNSASEKPDGSSDRPRLIDFGDCDNKDDLPEDDLANLTISNPECCASRCGLRSPATSHDSGIASPDDLSLASELMPANGLLNVFVPLANDDASAHAEPDVLCSGAAKGTTVSKYVFVGIACSRVETLCFISSPRLDKEAGLVDEYGVIQIGQWLAFDIVIGPPDDVHHVSQFSAIDAPCTTVRNPECIIVQCEVVVRQTVAGPPVIACRMCSPVHDPERLVRTLASGSYQAGLRYVYDDGQLSGYWCVDRVINPPSLPNANGV